MAMKLGEMFVRLSVDARGVRSGINEAQRSFSGFERSVTRLGGLLGGGLIFGAFIRESSQAQQALAQLEARLKSTGGAAGRSIEQLTGAATALQRISTFSDEAVQGAQALLLTFKNVKGAEFDRVTKATLDLATAMGTDLNSAALQLGKALEDPIRGMTALRRSGVSFSEAQEDVIKKLVKTGQIAKAQNLILAEMETQFGGAAKAARDTLGGALTALKNAFSDTLEVSGGASSGITGALNAVADALPGIRAKLDGFFRWWQEVAVTLAVGWQLALLQIKENWAGLTLFLGQSAQKSIIPAIRRWGAETEAAALRMKDAIDQDRVALEIWNVEQIAAIIGKDRNTAATNRTADATNELTKNLTAAEKALNKLLDLAQNRADQVMRALADSIEAVSDAIDQRLAGVGTIPDVFRSAPTRGLFDEQRGKRGRLPAPPMSFATVLEEHRRERGLKPGETYNPWAPEGQGKDEVAEKLGTISSALQTGLGSMGAQMLSGLQSITNALLVGGSGKGSQIGGALGGAFGGGAGAVLGGMAAASIGGMLGGAVGSAIPVVGTMIGTVLGSAIGGLFGRKAHRASDGLDRLGRAAERVAQAFTNIPSGFRVEPYRFGASDPLPRPAPAGPDRPTPPSGPGGPRLQVGTLNVNIAGASNVEQLVTSIEREVRRRAGAGALTLGLA